jgi:hypothetical protein
VTIAVCFQCGRIKHGAITRCTGCAAEPRNEPEIAWSLALSDQNLPVDELQRISASMLAGNPRPEIPREMYERWRAAAQASAPMLKSIKPRYESGSPLWQYVPAHDALPKGRRSRFKGILRQVGVAYVGIGGILASLLWFSYLFPLTGGASAHLSFWQQVRAIAVVQPIAVFYAGIRFVLWGPSLIVWTLWPRDHSFGQWLAPGFYSDIPSSVPSFPKDASVLRACLAKKSLHIEGYLVWATADLAVTLCPDIVGFDRAMMSKAMLAEYVLDEAVGSDCAKARRNIIDPITQRVTDAYKADGETAFCSWVKDRFDKQDAELWERFWK